MATQPSSTGARPPDQGDSAELARAAMVARRFYLGGSTKKEIGRQLGISRFKVARLLELACRQGLVHIEIKSPGGFDVDLANELQDRFDLTEVWIVEEVSSNTEDHREGLGIAAAPIVADLIEADEIVGIGWGRTLSSMVDHLPAFSASTVVQIAGGASTRYGDSPADLPRRLAERFGVPSFQLHVPLFVSDPATAQALRADAATAATLDMFGRLTTALIGIGAWAPEHPAITQALSASDIARLDSGGVVAHSLPLFFTSDGRVVSGSIRDRAVGITVEELRSVPRRIGIAGGRSKALALETVLGAGLLTHIVTDTGAAEALVARRS